MPNSCETCEAGRGRTLTGGPFLDLPAVVAGHARHRSEKIALRDAHGGFTYSELHELVERVAGALVAKGIGAGDRILTALQPSAAYAALAIGILRSGAILAPLNTRLAPLEARAYGGQLAPALVVCDTAARVSVKEIGAPAIELPGGSLGPLLGRPVDDRPRLDGIATIFPTGGTTGRPKGAMLPHEQMWLWMASCSFNGGRSSESVELYCSPFFHVTLLTSLFSTLFAGGSVVILDRFDPEQVLEAFDSWGVTGMLGAPTILEALRQHPRFEHVDRRRITRIAFGSMAFTARFVEDLRADYPCARIRAGYGATECGVVAEGSPEDLPSGRWHGTGRPIAGAEVRIVDTELRDVAAEQEGEILMRTPWQATGYWGQPEETEATFLADGWIRLGDMGVLSGDGWLTISGRLKEMVKTGGESVFPVEVEQVLADHPAVQRVAVFASPDPKWGERVEVAVVLRPGQTATLEELRAFARSSLAGYKLPKVLHVVDDFPLTANNKLDRRRLQAGLAPGVSDSGP